MSSKTKVEHTPGWRIKVRPHGRKAIEDAHGNVMANVLGYDVEANARLFAAAPDLLAALEKWLMHAENNRSAYQNKSGADVPLVRQTRAAIAKARGET